MSLSRMSAGAGYKYLLRHTACGDACREPGTALAAYYAASGYPAGRWVGSGLVGLDDGRGITAGTVVTEEAMAALYGTGHDPVAGSALGAAYPTYQSVDDRIAEALANLPAELPTDEHETQQAEIERVERARPVRAAIAGFDLTFTAPKSASVLWALGHTAVQQAVHDAHRDAVSTVLQVIEDRFLHTRVGPQGCAQVATRGMVAAAFDHWDTRTGDPNLHTHVVIANKVQGSDGKWRSLDSRALHHAAVACSELYDTLLADAIAARLPVSWSWRHRGERRSPAFEIDGLDDDLLAVFSTRSGQINAAMRGLVAEFRARHDREPTRRDILRMRQQATLATRPNKTVRPLGELIERWRATATTLKGQSSSDLVARALRRNSRHRGPLPGDATVGDRPDPDIDIGLLAAATVAGVGERRSTWTRANLLAEAARASRDLRLPTATERIAILAQIVDAALSRCVALDPPELFPTPHRFRRADGTSTFTRPDEHTYTTGAVLDAEDRLVRASTETGAPALTPDVLEPVLAAAMDGMPGARGLHPDQAGAVAAIAGSGRLLDVLVGPAGSGKTRALRALRAAWENTHGPGSVLGLAPSATAAVELSASLAIGCENTAKWLHDSDRSMRPAQLVIIDEASMVTTEHLDRLLTQARAAGAKILLVGDHAQLGAVGAGGAFALLAESPHTQTLHGLWRFRHRWEAGATRALRAGEPGAVDLYAEHGRLHDGPAQLMLDAAYTAWATDLASGHTAVLLAADRATVSELNTRAHEERVAAGAVQEDGIVLADDTSAGRGDLVVTRRNSRRLATSDGGHVRNGALWRVHDVHPDGGLDVTPVTGGEPLHLPADYVREHVELGYASTVHRAQGINVERAHVLASSAMNRQSLYVAMTRGRDANHVYIATDSPDTGSSDNPCPDPTVGTPASGAEILRSVLANDGAELSATATLRRRQNGATSLRRLLPIRELLHRAEHEPDPVTIEALDRIGAILRARAAEARSQRPPTPTRPRAPVNRYTQEGMQR